MGKFADNTWFEVETCCNCGIAFALPVDFQKRRREDHALFYCPSGHAQHYTGKSEAEKLRDELARSASRLNTSVGRANQLENERNQVMKAHKKMRTRVMNGVCPCCNRSFQNLREHMASQHADFGNEKTMKALREAFGMTQTDVAMEAHCDASHVSLYERGKAVPARAAQRLDWWRERQQQG